MTARNLFGDLALEGTQTAIRARLDGATTASGALAVGNALVKFRDGFASTDTAQPNPALWTLVNDTPDDGTGAGHVITQGGNAAGSVYLRISLSPFVESSAVWLSSVEKFRLPLRCGWGVTASQRVVGQEVFFGIAEADDSNPRRIRQTPAVSDLTTTGTITVTSNIATVTVPLHGLQGGDRVALLGHSDTRLNVGPVAVTVVDVNSITVPLTLGNGSYPSDGMVRVADPVSRARNALGMLLENSNPTNASLCARRNGAKYRTRNSGIVTTQASQVTTSPYTDALVAAGVTELYATMDEASYRSFGTDSGTGVTGLDKFTQAIPDEELDYRLHVRARILDGATRLLARITSITKTGTATATITTDRPHGLTTAARVGIYGVRDQTNFPNVADTAVASVPTATTFTVTIGGATTATVTDGGAVAVNHGSVTMPGAYGYGIQSVARIDGVLIVTLNTTAAGFVPGEMVQLWGLGGTGAASFEGAFKVLRQNAATIELAAPGPNATTITTGGAVVRRTDVRLHFVRIIDHTRHLVEVLGGRGNTADANNAVPVSITSSAALAVNPNAPTIVVELTESTTNLTAGSTYTGAARDLGTDTGRHSTRYKVMIRHLAGTAHGTAWLEQSIDNTTFVETWRMPVPSDGGGHTFEVPIHARYHRWRFTNGATAQTAFLFHTRRTLGEGAVASEAEKNLAFPLTATGGQALAASASIAFPALDLGGNHNWAIARAFVASDQAATVYLDESPDGTTWRTVGAGVPLTAGGAIRFDQPIALRHQRLRVVNGANAATALYACLALATL